VSHANRFALVYARNDVETGVAAADPHRLVLMLFDGAIRATTEALACLATGDIEGRARAVAKAVQIVEDGLRESLDTRQGGALAARLDGLYDYIGRRLLVGSARSDLRCFEEVRMLLGELREAWASIAYEPEPATATRQAVTA
jgi:flagellar protein FliS